MSGQGPRARTAFWLTAGTRAWCADSTFAPATMIGWWGSKFLAMIVGVLYPSLESYKALKTETKDDDIQVSRACACARPDQQLPRDNSLEWENRTGWHLESESNTRRRETTSSITRVCLEQCLWGMRSRKTACLHDACLRQWLAYWIVFALFTLVEFFLGTISLAV